MKIKPNLKTKNRNKEYLEIAKKYAKKIFSYSGVVGIAVGGGIGRDHSDEFSDIDLYVYLTSEEYQRWMKNPPIKIGSRKRGKYTIEIEIFDYAKENKSEEPWKIEDRWERQHHIVLYDTKSKVKNLLKNKNRWEKGEKEELLDELQKRASWYIELPEDFIERGDIAQAHYLINVVIDWIFDIVFLKNNYFIPWPKWKLHYALLIKKKPMDFEERIKSAMEIKSFDKKDVLRRIKILNKILEELR